MTNLNELPKALMTLEAGAKVTLNGSIFILGAGIGDQVCLVTADSRPELFFQLVRANVVVNDDELVIYSNFIKHVRPNGDDDTSNTGRAIMPRANLVDLIESGEFYVG